MTDNLYNRYFAKDKPLRHYTQHLFIAVAGYLFLLTLKPDLNLNNFLTFLFATYIIDLDGLISVYIFKEKIKEAGEIVSALRSGNFVKSATLGTIHHKKLNRLILHNVIGFLFLLLLLHWSLKTGNQKIFLITWAILLHFAFDIFDDIYQLGHINNWLWPISFLKRH